jgi:hypothetical protein
LEGTLRQNTALVTPAGAGKKKQPPKKRAAEIGSLLGEQTTRFGAIKLTDALAKGAAAAFGIFQPRKLLLNGGQHNGAYGGGGALLLQGGEFNWTATLARHGLACARFQLA